MESLYTSRHAVWNAFVKADEREQRHRARGLTQDTRATVDGVLDPRTQLLLQKFKTGGYIQTMGGTISTGKEANVYSATAKVIMDSSPQERPRAIKIFKTSILVFKNRRQYVEGEFRFRQGYVSASNPRKMVKQWAEKEFRNLKRLMQCGIRAPLPVCLRSHAFIMTLVGKDDVTPAPRLRDYPAQDVREWKRLYIEVIALHRALFQWAQLVHGDSSEYNILFHQGHPYIIDVSQSTDGSHCHAERFLKRDCYNITAFFAKKLGQADLVLKDEDADYLKPDESIGGLSDQHESDTEADNQAEYEDYSSSSFDDDSEDDGSDELAHDGSDDSVTSSEFDVAAEGFSKRDIRFNEKLGASALNRWKWDADLAKENEWNRLDETMHPQMLRALDDLEVLSVENFYNYVVAPDIGSRPEAWRWPEFDRTDRKRELDEVMKGRRMQAGGETAQNTFVVQMDERQFHKAADRFVTLCADSLAHVQRKKGTNTATDLNVFITKSAATSLMDLSIVDVERELKQGGETKYSAYIAAQQTAVAEGENVSDASSSDELAGEEGSEEGEAKFDGKIPDGVDPKEWKKQVKAANRERRQHKMSKKEKKQKIKKSRKR